MSLHGIENEEELLYSSNPHKRRDVVEGVGHLHRERVDVAWEEDVKEGMSFMTKLFIVTFLMAVCSAGFLYYKIMMKPVTVDNAKIDIVIETPEVVQGGQENKASITISNNNDISLNAASLVFSYDKGGTLGRTTEKVSITKDMGNVMAHSITKLEVPYTLFGQSTEEKKLYFTLSYHIEGSTGVFPKEEVRSVRISTPPLAVSVVGPESVVSGSQASYDMEISNPTDSVSKPSLLSLTFPASFSIVKIDQKEGDKKFTYDIPAILPGEKKKIKLVGVFTGKVGEKSSFRATVGKPEGQDENDDTTIYSYVVKGVTIATPGLAGQLRVESEGVLGESVRKNETVKAILVYKNESQHKISNITYSVHVPTAIDAESISVSNGYFDSGSRSLIWTSESVSDFAELGAQKAGVLSFSFRTPLDIKEDSLLFSVMYKGEDSTTHDELSGSKDIFFAVKGSNNFTAYTLFYDIDSKHGGPIPPKVDKETYITGVLSISSDTGLKDPKVVFSIPSLYVKWMGGVGTTSISYDARSKMVSWTPGIIEKGGSSLVKFMLVVKPSLVHLGTAPQLSSQIVLTGSDLISNEKITQVASPLSTSVQDAGQKYEIGVVIK